jgi:uncharacterized alkaline shock family protein YloU
MSDYHRPPGRTTVSPGVLMAIARMAALGVAGVKGVGRPTASGNVFRRREAEGVRMFIQDGLVSGDIYLVLKGGMNIREVGREVQNQVARAIQETVGTPVSRIDIHVENIDYEGGEA